MAYRLTPKRRQSILKAQRISARKKHTSAKNQVGYWIAKGVRRAGNKATLGVAGMIVNLKEINDIENRKRRRRR
jgi:hypothetical protein